MELRCPDEVDLPDELVLAPRLDACPVARRDGSVLGRFAPDELEIFVPRVERPPVGAHQVQ